MRVVAKTGLAAIEQHTAYQQQSQSMSEALQYITDSLTNIKDTFDFLSIWKDLELKYSRLALMTKNILAIPATGMGAECNFSAGCDQCGYHQDHLGGTTLENTMIIKHYQQVQTVKSHVIESLDEDEKQDKKQDEEQVSQSADSDEEINRF